MGVVSAGLRFAGVQLVGRDASTNIMTAPAGFVNYLDNMQYWLTTPWSELLALVAYAFLILYLIKASMKVK